MRTATATASMRSQYQIPSVLVATILIAIGGGQKQEQELLLPLARLIGVVGCQRVSTQAKSNREHRTISAMESRLPARSASSNFAGSEARR